jgi:hypothetical protein
LDEWCVGVKSVDSGEEDDEDIEGVFNSGVEAISVPVPHCSESTESRSLKPTITPCSSHSPVSRLISSSSSDIPTLTPSPFLSPSSISIPRVLKSLKVAVLNVAVAARDDDLSFPDPEAEGSITDNDDGVKGSKGWEGEYGVGVIAELS